MTLADFIDARLAQILGQATGHAADRGSGTPSLRGHVPGLLRAIGADLRTSSSAEIGQAASLTSVEVQRALASQGKFSLLQLLDEFRALRATVAQLWEKASGPEHADRPMAEIMRFNALVDQAMAESARAFERRLAEDEMARAKVDRELELSRGRLEYASRLSNVGFWYCDLPFDVLEWDPQVKEHFFIAPTSPVTIDLFYDRIHPEDREPTRAAIAKSIERRTAYDIVYRTVHPASGEVKWIRALGGTDYAGDGTPIHFDGITVDVTAQKIQEKRIAESEARLRGVLTHMDEAFVLFDADFNLVEANDAACQLIGSTRADLLGANHWERFPGTYDSELGQLYRRVLADGKSGMMENHYTFEDGRQYWFDIRAFKVDPGIAVLFRDVTERRGMIEAMRSADKRKDEFLAMLAHELRNPLAPITTAGEILSRIADAPAPVTAAAAVVKRQARHMTRLIDDLLDVARVTQGRIHLQRAIVDIAEVIMQSCETCEPQRQAKHQRLSMAVEASAPLYVDGDFPRLVQCVVNVLNNAIKYTDTDGEIAVGVRADGDEVVIRITDSGIGIAPEFLPSIFDLFTQSQRALDRSEGGLGVGLAVTKRLIDMHGGQVRATSEGIGLGSTFEIRLPRSAAPTAVVEPAHAATASARRVLVVDDNVDAAQALGLLLEMQGHTVLAVHGPHDALAQAPSFDADIMLIDIGLPEIDGYGLIARLRDMPLLKDVRAIALTGYGQARDRQLALAAGFDEHLVKPVNVEALEAAIAKLCAARQSHQD